MKVFISGDGPNNELSTWLEENGVEITNIDVKKNGKGVEGTSTSSIRDSDIIIAHHPMGIDQVSGIIPFIIAKQSGICSYLFVREDSNSTVLDPEKSTLPHLVEIKWYTKKAELNDLLRGIFLGLNEKESEAKSSNKERY